MSAFTVFVFYSFIVAGKLQLNPLSANTFTQALTIITFLDIQLDVEF